INPFMLYGRHLGYRGNFEKALAEHEPKALELFHNLEAVKQEAARFMKVRVVWRFFEAHAIQALAIETAEGAAEWLHRRIREDWGFPDPSTLTMHDRFTSKYRGKR